MQRAQAFLVANKRFFITAEYVFGCSVALINMARMHKSPEYHGTNFDFMRCMGMSVLKGAIYGVFFPVAPVGMTIDLLTGNQEQFEAHFTPFSKYNRRGA